MNKFLNIFCIAIRIFTSLRFYAFIYRFYNMLESEKKSCFSIKSVQNIIKETRKVLLL